MLLKKTISYFLFSSTILSLSFGDAEAKTTAEAVALRCEYLSNPLGLDVVSPRLSWRLSDERRGARQTAYQIQVASSLQLLQGGKPDIWDSGEVISDHTSQISYGGPSLKSFRRY